MNEDAINERLDRIEAKVDRNLERIAELRGASIATTLIKWVIFPLVSILAGAYGLSQFVHLPGV